MVKGIDKSKVPATSKALTMKYIIAIIAANFVDWEAFNTIWKNATGGKITSDVPLTTSAPLWMNFECAPGSVSFNVTPGESPYNGRAQISAIVDGVDETTLDWAFACQGEEVVAKVTRCSDGKVFVFANPCTGGMTFQYQQIGSQDGGKAGISFNLTGTDCPQPVMVLDLSSHT